MKKNFKTLLNLALVAGSILSSQAPAEMTLEQILKGTAKVCEQNANLRLNYVQASLHFVWLARCRPEVQDFASLPGGNIMYYIFGQKGSDGSISYEPIPLDPYLSCSFFNYYQVVGHCLVDPSNVINGPAQPPKPLPQIKKAEPKPERPYDDTCRPMTC